MRQSPPVKIMNEETVLLKIGELTGLVSAMSLRIDTMHSDNGIRIGELIDTCSDIKAQIHEVKHSQNDAAQKVLILEQKTQAHRESDDTQHALLIDSQESLRNEILQNRDNSRQKFEELFSIKNKVTGIIFFIVIILGVFGRDIWEQSLKFWGK